MKIRNLSEEYGLDIQIPIDGSDKFYEIPEEEMYALIDDAEMRGREAARREIINAITGKTTSQRKEAEISGTTYASFGYNYDDGEVYKMGGTEQRKILKSDSYVSSEPDSVLHQLPEEISDGEELPDFIKKDAPKERKTTLQTLEEQLKVGWYQIDTNLIYWDGVTWRFNAGDTSDTRMSYPPKDLERMEFLG